LELSGLEMSSPDVGRPAETLRERRDWGLVATSRPLVRVSTRLVVFDCVLGQTSEYLGDLLRLFSLHQQRQVIAGLEAQFFLIRCAAIVASDYE
jgi:hypothetical protein